MANFPTNLDTIKKDWANDSPVKDTHPSEHNLVAESVEALEAKVGVDGSAVTTTHDYKLSNVTDGDKASSITGTETLTNKTLPNAILNTPAITNPTGLDKNDVGLSNVTNAAQVELTGAQTVAGVKTFSSSPIIPDPTTAQQPVTKAYFEANTNIGAPEMLNVISGDGINVSQNLSTDDLTVKAAIISNNTTFGIRTSTEFRTFTSSDFGSMDRFDGLGIYNGDVYVFGYNDSSTVRYLSKFDLSDLASATEEVIDITTNSILPNSDDFAQMCVVNGVFYFSTQTNTGILIKATLAGTTLGSKTTITLSGNTVNTSGYTGFAVLTGGNFIIRENNQANYELFNSSGVSQGMRNNYFTQTENQSGLMTYYETSSTNNIIYLVNHRTESLGIANKENIV